ncbi:MAG: hypothetical protein ACI9VR_000735 [Cognaticolwellia sp.]|jgi:hypothetical protein
MLLALLLSCSTPSPGILLVTLDGMRGDYLHPDRSPNAWALGEKGQVYQNAWTPVGDCLPAMQATFVKGGVKGEPGLALADSLESAGWATGAVVSSAELSGLELGFEHWDAPADEERGSEQSVALAQAWIQSQTGPWMLWVHLNDPQAPYVPNGRFVRPQATPKSNYAGEVGQADAAMAPLLDLAQDKRAHIILMSDHGQVMDEETCTYQNEHSSAPMVMRVPLVIQGPGIQAGVSDDMVGLTDLYDTVQTWAGVASETNGVLERRGRSYWVGRSGSCSAECNPGCTPLGPEGADRVVYGENGGMYRDRPGTMGFGDAMLAGALE